MPSKSAKTSPRLEAERAIAAKLEAQRETIIDEPTPVSKAGVITEPPVPEKAELSQRVDCSCKWSGTVGDLLWDNYLRKGHYCPKCKECKTLTYR